jgi:hypothetical protein
LGKKRTELERPEPIEEKLNETGAQLQYIHRKDHSCLEEEIRVSKTPARNAVNSLSWNRIRVLSVEVPGMLAFPAFAVICIRFICDV